MKSKVEQAYENLIRAIQEEEQQKYISRTVEKEEQIVNKLFEKYSGKKAYRDVYVRKKGVSLIELFNIVNGTNYTSQDEAVKHINKYKKEILSQFINTSEPEKVRRVINEMLSDEQDDDDREFLIEVLSNLS